MKLIDTADPYAGVTRFHPQTQAQLGSCTPVVDYHYMLGNPHCSERFQTSTLFLRPTYKENRGFAALEHYESREADNIQRGDSNGIN